MPWKELQRETHRVMWNRVSLIVNGKSDLFELDEDGEHMVHKRRDDQEASWSRWPIPEEWKEARVKSLGKLHDRGATKATIHQPEQQECHIGPVTMVANVIPRQLTCTVLGLASPVRKVCKYSKLTQNCADRCARLKRKYKLKDHYEACEYFRFILAMHEETLGREPH